MIFPPGHHQPATTNRRLTRRERWMLSAVLGAALALTAVVVIAVSTASHRSARGCVDFTFPSSTGGREVYRCGAGARALCRLVGAPGGYGGMTARSLAAECRKAGLPVGA